MWLLIAKWHHKWRFCVNFSHRGTSLLKFTCWDQANAKEIMIVNFSTDSCRSWCGCSLRIYPPVTWQSQTTTFGQSAHFSLQWLLVIGEIRSTEKFLVIQWISSNSYPLNLLLVQSHQAEMIIVKRLMQGHSNVTRVRVGPKSCDQVRCKNDAFALLAMVRLG